MEAASLKDQFPTKLAGSIRGLGAATEPCSSAPTPEQPKGSRKLVEAGMLEIEVTLRPRGRLLYPGPLALRNPGSPMSRRPDQEAARLC